MMFCHTWGATEMSTSNACDLELNLMKLLRGGKSQIPQHQSSTIAQDTNLQCTRFTNIFIIVQRGKNEIEIHISCLHAQLFLVYTNLVNFITRHAVELTIMSKLLDMP